MLSQICVGQMVKGQNRLSVYNKKKKKKAKSTYYGFHHHFIKFTKLIYINHIIYIISKYVKLIKTITSKKYHSLH